MSLRRCWRCGSLNSRKSEECFSCCGPLDDDELIEAGVHEVGAVVGDPEAIGDDASDGDWESSRVNLEE